MAKKLSENPTSGRLRKLALWLKPSWKMSFGDYAEFYSRFNPKVVEKLRGLTNNPKRFEFMAKHYRKLCRPESEVINHAGLVDGLHRLDLPSNSHIVSFGAGKMYHESFLLKEIPQISFITGVDPLKIMRKSTKRTALNILGLKKRKKIKNIEGSFEDSPKVPPTSADAVISNEAFHHVRQPELALKNMVSKLKPKGGMVIIYRPNYKTNPPTPAQIERILETFGLRTRLNKLLIEDPNEPNNNLQIIVAKKS